MALAIKLFVNDPLSAPSPLFDADALADLGDIMGDFESPLLEINAVISMSESFALSRRWCPCDDEPSSTSSMLLLFLPLATLGGERTEIPVEFMLLPMDILTSLWRRIFL
jgi:hypothetical protein